MTLLADIVAASQRVGETASRRAKIATLADCLRALQHDEIAAGVAYLAGETRQGRAGIGWAAIRDAQGAAAGAVPQLTLIDVDSRLQMLMETGGRGSAATRTALLRALFEQATTNEQEFLVRLLLGELRQGALAGLMVEAVAVAADIPAAEVRRAAMVAGGIKEIAPIAMREGIAGLSRFAIRLFQPVASMLAQPADDIEDAMTRLGTAALEWKMDGARVQVHKSGNDVRIYTRSLNDVTAAAPEDHSATRDCEREQCAGLLR